MSNTYTCLSCRIHSIARRSRQLALRQQRWVSQSSQWRQDLQTPLRRQGIDSAEVTPEPRYRDKSGGRRPEEQLRGRYSGRRLAPEQLLDQLETAPKQYGQERYAQQSGNRPGTRSIPANSETPSDRQHGPSKYLEKPMYLLRGKAIILTEGTEYQDQYFWDEAMNAIGQTSDPQNPSLLMAEIPFRRKMNHWMNRVLDRWVESEFNPNRDPTLARQHADAQGKQRLTPYQALKCKSYFTSHPGTSQPRTLWLITKAVAEFDASYNKPNQPTHPAVLEGIHELMRIWHLFMALNLCNSAPMSKLREILDAPNLDWSFLPESTAFVDNLVQQKHQNKRILLTDIMDMVMTSNFEKPSDRKLVLQKEVVDLESSAVVTLGILQNVKTRPNGVNVIKDFEPWMRFVEDSIKNLSDPIVPNTLAIRMQDLGEEDPKRLYYKATIENLRLNTESLKRGEGPIQKVWEQNASNSNSGSKPEIDVEPQPEEAVKDGLAQVPVPNSSSSQAMQMTYTAIKRLGRAVEEGNLRAAERVRYDISRFKSQNREGLTQIPQVLYEHLIYSYLRLRQIRTSVQLWEEMTSEGYEPRLKTYTTMMRGSQHLRDLNSMEFFWNLMRKANIQPDATAWSTRISGLLRYEHTEPGLKALSEMGQNWLAAAKQEYMKDQSPLVRRSKNTPEVTAAQLLARHKGDLGDVPRPNVVIMNSAITALARGPDHLIPKVLAWGRSFGIEPDLITYNAFLHVAMRHNQGGEALKILQRMRERNIEVDSNTWTIILTDMLVGGYLDGLASEEQQEKVSQFLAVVDAGGARGLDQKGYALLLDRLLKNYENHPAAQAVLTHMASKDIEPSRHIYTILMDSHLRQTPPNFAAAEALWEHVHSAKGGYGEKLDSKFFDLVIKGYAPHHATIGIEKLLSILDRMDKDGKKPSWAALEATVRALAERSEWARLAQIVDKTRRRLRDERGIDTGLGQFSFWQFVISTGMLRHEKITTPQQIMGMA